MPKNTWIGIALLLAVALTGCAPKSDDPVSTAPQIVATTGMIGYTAEQIGGELFEIHTLMGPGVDPHLYKASEGDVQRLSDADLILYNGLHLEGKMGDILVKLASRRPVLAVAAEIPEERLREPPEFQGQYDPHVWFDVSLWIETLEPIEAALIALRPDDAEALRERSDALRKEWLELDGWVEQSINAIPQENRVLVTAHDAFGYFGQRYGIEVIGIQGLSTLSEAGLNDLDRVVDLVVERKIPSIFVESSVPRRAIEAVQAACRDRGHAVTIGGELFSDAMGPKGTPEGSYEGMVRHNTNTISNSLR